MRSVRFSITFNDQLNELLDYGEPIYGSALVEQKKSAVYNTIEHILAEFPGVKQPNPELGLTVYPIKGTPFVVLYDFDDQELRLHFVFQRGADLRDLDPHSAVW